MLGALFAVWLVDGLPPARIAAQETPGTVGPQFPSPEIEAPPRAARQELALAPPVHESLFNAEGLSPDEAVAVAVYERVNRSVVNITTKTTRGDAFLFLEYSAEGSGSGSIIDTQGHIITNYHVVEDAREVAVTLYDGKTWDATVIGADPINDVAVIKIDAPESVLTPVEFADSSNLKVGMRVFAIGNPFGLERTMTTGIISSLNRSLQIRGNRTIKSIIQIDAAVNPGNSGGPLLDAHGRLIGMNTAIASNTGQSAGVGFAIPVNLCTRVLPQLIRHGRVFRPEIGVQQVYETDQGLLIARLVPGGPAERAGLRGPAIDRRRRGPFLLERVDRSAADLIVAVDGEEVKTADDFLGLIERHEAGERVVLTILREGRKMNVPVTLGGEQP
jgi:S1-C subfamily serine protease